MRYLIILALLLPAACGVLRRGDDVPAPQPQTDSETTADLDATPPEESDLLAGSAGLDRPAQTVAGLGDPTRPGLWLETPLVTAPGPGQVRLASGGSSVQVSLIPAPGEASAGSRLSLEAMRQLGAPLSELVELEVLPGS